MQLYGIGTTVGGGRTDYYPCRLAKSVIPEGYIRTRIRAQTRMSFVTMLLAVFLS